MTTQLLYGLRSTLCFAFFVSLTACAAAIAPAPDLLVVVDTVEVQARPDPELERRAATAELGLLERSAQVADLQRQLDAARQEVVRAMARLQTLASRAEAASAMAEAEIGVQAVIETAGEQGEEAPAAAEARRLLALSAAEFADDNYGGALYLASQARSLARAGEIRLVSEELGDRQPGEVLFALPVPLVSARRSNVRAGPGLGHRILFTVEPRTHVVGRAHTDEWVRITDDQDRDGWIFHNLVTSPGGGGR